MKNFKEIAEKCLAGELSGVFVFQNGQKILSSKLQKFDKDASYDDYPYYIDHICTLTNYGFGYNSDYNVIDFIPDKMTQKKIEIDIPEGKVLVMEQTESGVVITWKEKELTYEDIKEKLSNDRKYIGSFGYNIMSPNLDTQGFYRKMEVIHKLVNIRNYFGKPASHTNCYRISYDSYGNKFYVDNISTIGIWIRDIVFAKKEHAEQTIKMLGDELKYLFEPW